MVGSWSRGTVISATDVLGEIFQHLVDAGGRQPAGKILADIGGCPTVHPNVVCCFAVSDEAQIAAGNSIVPPNIHITAIDIRIIGCGL